MDFEKIMREITYGLTHDEDIKKMLDKLPPVKE